jgi:hypothetical protein
MLSKIRLKPPVVVGVYALITTGDSFHQKEASARDLNYWQRLL